MKSETNKSLESSEERPLLVFRVGYMSEYNGAGDITGGGANIKKNKSGGEMWNFRTDGGRVYGYVMTVNHSGIDLKKIFPKIDLSVNQEVAGIDIVFIASHPTHGQVIVGWYTNATVFHKQYRERRGGQNKGDWDKIEYLSECEAENAFLIPEKSRSFSIPRGKNRPGQSNVWYGSGDDSRKEIVKDIRAYINEYKQNHIVEKNAQLTKTNKKFAKPNKERILQIEASAVTETRKYFEGLGYHCESVERDYCGWDLILKKGSVELLAEVKGHAGNVVQFEMTPNEYSKMQILSSCYRVCVVRNALDNPDLVVCRPLKEGDVWYLISESTDEKIVLTEKVGAKAFTVS